VKFLSAGNVQIDYEVWGTGPPVLLIHGFASNAQVNWIDTGWVTTLDRAGFQAITFDNRGHGRSGKLYDPAAYRGAAMARDAADLIMHLGHARSAVVGYSMGARIAAKLASGFPALVSAAIFAGLAANMMRGFANREVIAQALEADTPEAIEDSTARTYRAFADQTGGDLKALAACMRASAEGVSQEELSRIHTPVLVVAGSQDGLAGPIAPLVEVLPNARALVLPGRDHMKAVGDRFFKDEAIRFLKLHRMD
jgi:pimeloyl-ACP methyl ester carboxylesterase